jgi:hypothetical protein
MMGRREKNYPNRYKTADGKKVNLVFNALLNQKISSYLFYNGFSRAQCRAQYPAAPYVVPFLPPDLAFVANPANNPRFIPFH